MSSHNQIIPQGRERDESERVTTSPSPLIWFAGYLTKKRETMFSPARRLYFTLLETELRYYTAKGGILRGTFSLQGGITMELTDRALRLMRSHDILILTADGSMDRSEQQTLRGWATALQSAMDRYQLRHMSQDEQLDELKRRCSHSSMTMCHRPAWQPDALAAECNGCARRFDTLFRRHHCRRCGLVVCGPCSTRRLPLPPAFPCAVRVCDGCFGAEGGALASAESDSHRELATAASAPSQRTHRLVSSAIPGGDELQGGPGTSTPRPFGSLDEWRAAGADHLRLGITLQGIRKWCRLAGFPIIGRSNEPGGDEYSCAYERAEGSWIEQVFGDPHIVANAEWRDGNYVGYDVCEHAKAWLHANGKFTDKHDMPTQSICEVLLSRGWEEVRLANVFYSHIQGKWLRRTLGCMEVGCRAYRSELGAETDEDVVFWLDYFTLRQCQSDFHVVKVQEIIKEIGFTMVELDNSPQAYLGRSFCILEAFATVAGGA